MACIDRGGEKSQLAPFAPLSYRAYTLFSNPMSWAIARIKTKEKTPPWQPSHSLALIPHKAPCLAVRSKTKFTLRRDRHENEEEKSSARANRRKGRKKKKGRYQGRQKSA